MDVFENDSYKDIIKEAVKRKQETKKSFNLKRLSEQIPLQYTYLSKVLNKVDFHLSEDHLFKACRILDFENSETEYIIALRQFDASQDNERRDFLIRKIENFRKEKRLNKEKFSYQGISHNQAEYLFNPLVNLIHVALGLDSIQKDTLKLCSLLGMTRQGLRESLQVLVRNHFIEVDPEDPFRVLRVHQQHMHIGRDNPMMRIHQNLIKTKMASKSYEVSEENKNSFLVTFTADQAAFDKINIEFNSFIKNVEEIVKSSTHQKLYQMSFDLFRWI